MHSETWAMRGSCLACLSTCTSLEPGEKDVSKMRLAVFEPTNAETVNWVDGSTATGKDSK